MKKLISVIIGLFIGVSIYSQAPVKIVNPISKQVIVNITNETDDSAYYSFSLGNYSDFSLDLLLSGGVSCKAFATLNDSLSVTSEANWVDYNSLFFGADSVYNNHTINTADDVLLDKILLKFRFSDATNRVIAILLRK